MPEESRWQLANINLVGTDPFRRQDSPVCILVLVALNVATRAIRPRTQLAGDKLSAARQS